jgi:hypothetical protein
MGFQRLPMESLIKPISGGSKDDPIQILATHHGRSREISRGYLKQKEGARALFLALWIGRLFREARPINLQIADAVLIKGPTFKVMNVELTGTD